MSILVTGSVGYIGSHMVHDLADAGERVIVLDNLSTGFDWAIRKGVPLVVGDTGDQNLVSQILRSTGCNLLSISQLRPSCRIRQRSARLLQKQYRQLAGVNRYRGQEWGAPVHLFIDARGLW
jgi:hypothetical protein